VWSNLFTGMGMRIWITTRMWMRMRIGTGHALWHTQTDAWHKFPLRLTQLARPQSVQMAPERGCNFEYLATHQSANQIVTCPLAEDTHTQFFRQFRPGLRTTHCVATTNNAVLHQAAIGKGTIEVAQALKKKRG